MPVLYEFLASTVDTPVENVHKWTNAATAATNLPTVGGAGPSNSSLSVFAVWRTLAGRWSIVAPCCRDLSGRIGVRGVAVLDEPAAGGAKIIKLKEHAGIDRRA